MPTVRRLDGVFPVVAERRERQMKARGELVLMYVRVPSSARARSRWSSAMSSILKLRALRVWGLALSRRFSRHSTSAAFNVVCRFRRSDEGNAAVAASLTIGTLRTASRTSSWFTFLPLR